jgi:CDP-diglyceride synthetase
LAFKREIAAAITIPIVLSILFFARPVVFNAVVGAIALAALWEL